MDESIPRLGRPYGECAIIWRSDISSSVTPVDCNDRYLCDVKLSLDDESFLLIPCVNKREDTNDDEYAFVDGINQIELIMHLSILPMLFVVAISIQT